MNRLTSNKPKYPCMRHLMTRGTFYDVGYNVGLNFSQSIRLYFAESDNFQDQVLPFYDSQVGRDFYDKNLRACQDCFPQYVRELRGISDGAGISFEHIFLENVSGEINMILNTQKQPEEPKQEPTRNRENNENKQCQSQAIDEHLDQSSPVQTPELSSDPVSPISHLDSVGCSDVFVNRPGLQLMIHNEDGYPMTKRYGYLLSAEIEEDGLKEQFTSFCCPGGLPGFCWSFNAHGLANSIDLMCPTQVVQESPARQFICRALLGARDVEDAVKIVQNAPYGVAYGFCVNMSTKAGRMASVEVAPGQSQGLVHVHDIKQQTDPDAPCHYYHFNLHKHLTEVPELREGTSSVNRTKRVEELPPPRTRLEALTVLADTHDQIKPIFRTPRPTDLAETVNTALFDVTARQVLVYQGREDLLSDTPFAKLPMYQ